MKKSKWRRWVLGAIAYTCATYSMLAYDAIIQGDGRFIRFIVGGTLIGLYVWYGWLCGSND